MTIENLMKLTAGVIQSYMGLANGQVVLYASDWKVPNDKKLYIVISYNSVSQQVLGVKSEFNTETNQETASVVTHEQFTIEMLSHGTEAINRASEIFMALNSQSSRFLQEKNNIRIFRAGGILDLSSIEGSGALHRIQIPIIISNVQNKTTNADYFDKFTETNIKTEE